MTTPEKFIQLLIVIVLFVGVMTALLILTSKAQSKRGELFQSVAFVLPAVLMIALGLLYPAIKTIIQSFQDTASLNFVGPRTTRRSSPATTSCSSCATPRSG